MGWGGVWGLGGAEVVVDGGGGGGTLLVTRVRERRVPRPLGLALPVVSALPPLVVDAFTVSSDEDPTPAGRLTASGGGGGGHSNGEKAADLCGHKSTSAERCGEELPAEKLLVQRSTNGKIDKTGIYEFFIFLIFMICEVLAAPADQCS